jgi:hypothetical protein
MKNIEFWMNFAIENSNKLQKMGLGGKMNWVCLHLGPITHDMLSSHEGR